MSTTFRCVSQVLSYVCRTRTEIALLQVFVVDNQGGEDVTRIDKLELIGLDIAGTKMSDLQKQEDE